MQDSTQAVQRNLRDNFPFACLRTLKNNSQKDLKLIRDIFTLIYTPSVYLWESLRDWAFVMWMKRRGRVVHPTRRFQANSQFQWMRHKDIQWFHQVLMKHTTQGKSTWKTLLLLTNNNRSPIVWQELMLSIVKRVTTKGILVNNQLNHDLERMQVVSKERQVVSTPKDLSNHQQSIYSLLQVQPKSRGAKALELKDEPKLKMLAKLISVKFKSKSSNLTFSKKQHLSTPQVQLVGVTSQQPKRAEKTSNSLKTSFNGSCSNSSISSTHTATAIASVSSTVASIV